MKSGDWFTLGACKKAWHCFHVSRGLSLRSVLIRRHLDSTAKQPASFPYFDAVLAKLSTCFAGIWTRLKMAAVRLAVCLDVYDEHCNTRLMYRTERAAGHALSRPKRNKSFPWSGTTLTIATPVLYLYFFFIHIHPFIHLKYFKS